MRALGKGPKFRLGGRPGISFFILALAGVGMAALAFLTAGTGVRVAGASEAWLQGGGPGEIALRASGANETTLEAAGANETPLHAAGATATELGAASATSTALAAAGATGTALAAAGGTEASPGETPLSAAALPQETPRDTAVFAGGCFWCMEPPYDKTQGVVSTISGYAGGDVPNPSYEQVTAGGTGHREAVQVIYNPEEVAYERLLEIFWRNVDPLDDGGQFCDRGFSYTTAIFAKDPEQAQLAEESKESIQERFSQPVVTPVVRDAAFYPAEEYHQNYYQEHSIRYSFYRWSCGRDDRLEELWGQEAGGAL